MFANALFYVALIAMTSSTLLSAGLFMARVTIARQAEAALTPGYQRAAEALQQRIAAAIQNGGLPNPLPSFTPLPPVCADSACSYKAAETIVIQPDGAINEEANGYVNEHRVTAHISVTVRAPGGEMLATRSDDVIVRTFDTPPYAAITGANDGSFDGLSQGQTAGDAGGTLPATPNPCGGTAPGDDTVIRVAYRNTVTGACTDGSQFRSNASSAASNSSGWRP
jgi:hypothetical protein